MQKGSAALFLIIGILMIVGIISLFYFSLNKKTALPLQLSKPSTQATVPMAKIPSYTNQSLGFEFEYPQDFSVTEDSEEEFNKRGNGNYRKNFKGYVGYEPATVVGAVAVIDQEGKFDKNPFSIWVFDNPEDLTVEKWFEDYWYYPFIWGVFDYTSKGHIVMDQEATVGGQPAKYKVISYQPGSPKFIYTSKDQKMYLFRVIGESGDKILSSFKFIDQNQEKAEGKFCGGIAANLPEFQCPSGYRCQLDGDYPDAGGKCVKL